MLKTLLLFLYFYKCVLTVFYICQRFFLFLSLEQLKYMLYVYHELSMHANIYLSNCNIGSFFALTKLQN